MSSSILELRNSITDLARTFLWEISIPGLVDFGVPSARLVTLLAETTSMPGRMLEAVEVHHKNGKMKLAGKVNFDGTLTCNFKEVREWTMRRAFVKWSEFVQNSRTGEGGLPSEYKKQSRLKLLDSKQSTQLIIVVDGIYPENVDPMDLDYTSSEKVNFPITFSYDHWFLEE